MAGLILSHAAADGFEGVEGDDGPMIAGMPARFSIDIVCNYTFNATDDLWSQLDRHLRLWRDYGEVGAGRHLGVDAPADLFAEATGMDIGDCMALAFALFSGQHRLPNNTPFVPVDFSSDMDRSTIDRFVNWISATPDGNPPAPLLQKQRSDWDFLAFRHPVVRFDEGLVVIDPDMLMERVTNGLYWPVHDHLKEQSEARRQAWTQAWGDMIEALVEDELKPHRATDLTGGKTFFTEDDLAAAYPGHKTADVVLDLGEQLAAIEIVSGQWSLKSRVDGDVDSFFERHGKDRLQETSTTGRHGELPASGSIAAPGCFDAPAREADRRCRRWILDVPHNSNAHHGVLRGQSIVLARNGSEPGSG